MRAPWAQKLATLFAQGFQRNSFYPGGFLPPTRIRYIIRNTEIHHRIATMAQSIALFPFIPPPATTVIFHQELIKMGRIQPKI